MANNISKKQIDMLSFRALRLAEDVLRATERSTVPEVRKEGARLGEILEEWIDELTNLFDADDETIEDRANAFAIRLHLAEKKVRTWYAPVVAEVAKKPKVRKPRRRAKTAA